MSKVVRADDRGDRGEHRHHGDGGEHGGLISPPKVGVVLATAAGVVACAPATWAIASLLPTQTDPAIADYLVDPPDLSAVTRSAIGIAAAVLAAAAIAVFVRSVRHCVVDRSWFLVVALLAFVSSYIGFTYAAVTAPTIGANIGAGILLMAGGLLVPICTLSAAVLAWRAAHR